MDQTARFALPYLAPGQMQKEFYHNEALQKIDTLLCPVVEGNASPTPPSDPAVGTCYLIASGATGAWRRETVRWPVSAKAGGDLSRRSRG